MADAVRTHAHFNADAIAAAQEAPMLTVGGLLYRGRLLSIEQWLPYWERMQDMDRRHSGVAGVPAPDMPAALRERARFFREYLRAVFPPGSYRFWAPDPVEHLMRKPFQVIESMVGFFFILQARATFNPTIVNRALETAGTPSSAPTAGPPEGNA
jgi:hypothetical protein